MKNKEIEIKVKIHQPEKLKNWLDKHAQYVWEKRQIDTYFDPPDKTFITTLSDGKKIAYEYLRIRQSETWNSICYKRIPKTETGEMKIQFVEFETKIEDAETMFAIYNAIWCKEIAVIDKIRNTYTYNDFSLEVDTVKDLGIFLEVEYAGTSEDADAIETSLFDFIKSIDIWKFDIDNEGYVQLRWMKQNW